MATIAVVMGSKSDWPTMQHAALTLRDFGVPCDVRILSAHRTPQALYDFAATCAGKYAAVIAGAGGAAHLPGMLAALTPVPVYGVPVSGKLLGLDALLSIVQMPPDVPVATVGIGAARNAALHVIRWLATRDSTLAKRLADYSAVARQIVAADDDQLSRGWQ